MRARPIVLLEFNELCPDLLGEWMDEGLLPNFRRFHDASRVFVAEADVTEQCHLEPWIQWYSLHTGFSYDQHGVFHLTDGPGRGLKDVWRLLLDNGYTVANCAGMNAPGFQSAGSFYLPDPWCNSQAPYPAELEAYQNLVLREVQENSNAAAPLSGKDILRFLAFWTSHGASPGSVGSIARQLLREGAGRDQSWRRATILDTIQADIFLDYWRRLRPDFGSFFINSTAHFQHAYFHLLESRAFGSLSQASAEAVHKDAVLFGYQEMDRLLPRFFKLEEDGALLVLSTGLSQRPNPDAGSIFYRPCDVDALLRRIGVHPTRLLPVMAHQYSAEFPTCEDAERARELLAAIQCDGRPVFDVSSRPPASLFFGVGAHADVPHDSVVTGFATSNQSAPFYGLFYKLRHTKSGMHHPHSALWFKSGEFRVHAERVSILDVLPTLAEYYDVDAPPEEGMARTGVSLLRRLGIAPYAARRAPRAERQADAAVARTPTPSDAALVK